MDEWVGGEWVTTTGGWAWFMDGGERAEPEGGTLDGVKTVNEPMSGCDLEDVWTPMAKRAHGCGVGALAPWDRNTSMISGQGLPFL